MPSGGVRPYNPLTHYPHPLPSPTTLTRYPHPLPRSEGETGDAEGVRGGTKGEASTCSVCLCDLMPGEVARTLPCKHRFHMSCIDAWLTENSHVCPADGLPVLPDAAT